MKHKWIIALSLALCLTALLGVFGARAEAVMQQDQWLFRITEGGTAEILGYADASASRLTIPARLGGAWVTAVGDGAFAQNAQLTELTVPARVAHIADSAFAKGAHTTLISRNGTQALRYAESHGMRSRNQSTLDFFADVLDLSEMSDSAWSVQGGKLRLETPYADLVRAGDEVYLPARGAWTQGMPVRLDTLTYEDGAVVAAFTTLPLTEALQSYHAEDVTLYLDLDAMELGEGVTLAPVPRGVASSEMGFDKGFKYKKSFSNGVKVEGGVTFGMSVTASVDYDWLDIGEISLTAKEFINISGNASYDGSDDEFASLSRSFMLFRAPLVSEGILSAWLQVDVVVNLDGEVSFSVETSVEQQLTARDNQVLSRKNVVTPHDFSLEAKASMKAGLDNKLTLRMGFPGSYDLSVELGGIGGYVGLKGTASYTNKAPKCFTITTYVEASATGEYVTMRRSNNGSDRPIKSVDLGDRSIQFWQKHWEGDTGCWQDTCTHSDLCTVSIFTGTGDVMEPILVEKGGKIGVPQPPARDGYTFDGWYKSLDGNVRFDFSLPIEEDVTLYAHWTQCTPTPEPTATPTPEPTVDPDATPTPTPAPTATPVVTEWYPYESIPGIAESFALCNVRPWDDDHDGIIDFYYIDIPDDVQALTFFKTYNGVPVEWQFGWKPNLVAVAYSNEYTEFNLNSIPRSAKTVYLPDSATSIIGMAGPISHVRLPSALKSIGESAFSRSNLEEIVIPENVISIGKDAFSSCGNLRYATIRSTVLESIGECAFSRTSLERITIPEGVTSIGNEAFAYCDDLKEISLPSTLRTIGHDAFWSTGLESIVIPEGITSIEERTFAYCLNLREVSLPSTLRTFGDAAFYFTGLESVVIPEGVTSFDSGVFSLCFNLKEMTLPGSLGTVNDMHFGVYGMHPLDKVIISEGVTEIGEHAFDGLTRLKEVSLPSTLRTIGAGAFADTPIDSITLPEGVTFIGTNAFRGCKNLKEITLPGSLQTLEGWTFVDAGIEKVVLSEGITEVWPHAFTGRDSLREVVLPSTLQTIGDYSFSESGLERITIPEGVRHIGRQAFGYCSGLKEITLPGTLQSIDQFAFARTGLESVVIPEGVTEIGYGAFQLSALKRVVWPCSPQSVGDNILSGCDDLEELVLTEGVTVLPDLDLGFLPLRLLTLPSTLTRIEGHINYEEALQMVTCYAESLSEETLAKINFSGVKAVCAYRESTIADYVRENFPEVQLLYLDAGDYYRVTFDTRRGTRPEDMFVKVGNLIPEPETSVWSSREFVGWYKDWHRTEPWDFKTDTMPEENITLYAKWFYTITGTVITQPGGRCYLKNVVDPEEELEIPAVMNDSLIVGLMPGLIPPGVKTVHLSSVVDDVRPGAFRRASDLTAITVDADNPNYYAVDGVLYARDGRLICYPAGKTQGAFSVPEGVTTLVEDAFAGCGYLTSLTLPSTLTTLASAAIYDCNALERVTFARAPQAIGEGCFDGCVHAALYGPTDAETLDAYTERFGLSYNVYRLIFSSDDTILAELSVRAGEPVTPIDGPTMHERILLGWTDKSTGSTPISFDQYVMPAHDLTLYAVWGYAFEWQDSDGGVELTRYTGTQSTIRVPETVNRKTVTAIAADAFGSLTGVTLVGNRGSVTETYAEAMGYAFQPLTYRLRFETDGGTQLPDQTLCATDPVVIPACTRIGYELRGWRMDRWGSDMWNEGDPMPAHDLTLYADWAYVGGETQYLSVTYRTAEDGIHITGFEGNSNAIHIPDHINNVPVVGIDDAAFAGCTTVSYVFMGDSVTSIGANAFQGMTALNHVELSGGLKALPSGAFQGCQTLTWLELPEGLEEIGSMAFAGCTRLREIALPSTLTSVAADAFVGCRSLSTLTGGSAECPVIDNALYTLRGASLALFPTAYAPEEYRIPEGVTAIDAAVQFPTRLGKLFIPESVTTLSADSFAYCGADLIVHVPAGSAAEAFFRQNLPHITLSNSSSSSKIKLTITWPDAALRVGVPVRLTCRLDDTALAPGDVSWSVDQPEIARITEKGELTFLHAGRPTITATLKTDASVRCTAQLVCRASQTLDLPGRLREAGAEAFLGGSMEGVAFPETMERIGSRAFADCPWLFDVRIPDGVTDIADDAFSGSPYVCIFCSEGSYAAAYARRRGIPCVTTPED